MRRRVKNWLLRYLFNAITIDEIITKDKDLVKIDGKPLDRDTILQLKAEAKALGGFRLWKLMTDSVRFQAKDKIFNKSLVFEDVMAGKLMLYNLDTLESIVKVINSLTTPK